MQNKYFHNTPKQIAQTYAMLFLTIWGNAFIYGFFRVLGYSDTSALMFATLNIVIGFGSQIYYIFVSKKSSPSVKLAVVTCMVGGAVGIIISPTIRSRINNLIYQLDSSQQNIILIGLIFGAILISLKYLSLRFKMWQVQRMFKLFITEPLDIAQNKSGSSGRIFPIILIILISIIIMILLSD